MDALIPDAGAHADARLSALERFLEHYLGPRRPEFGTPEADLASVRMPDPLRRFFRFAGRWPGHTDPTPFENRFCVQDWLCAVGAKEYVPPLQYMDDRLVFVRENQGVWVAATDPAGADPPVWISQDCSHREPQRVWRKLEKPLSHFLVSFVLQELMFGSEIVAAAPGALEKFRQSGFAIEPVWAHGEYAWDIDRPSYFLVADRFLLRRAPDEADGDDWYGCNSRAGTEVLNSLGLPTTLG